MSIAGVSRISALVGNQASGACTMQAQHSGGVLRWLAINQFAHVLRMQVKIEQLNSRP